MRSTIALPLLLAMLVGCGDTGGRPAGARVVLRIEDVLQLARQLETRMSTVVVTDGAGNTTEIATADADFPIKVELTSERAGPQLVTADAYAVLPDSDGPPTVITRGHATVDIDADAGTEVPLLMGMYCAGATEACPPIAQARAGCSTDAECDDDVFCNGQDRCIDGECRFDAIPCPYGADGCTISLCYESQRTCYAVPNAGSEGCADQS